MTEQGYYRAYYSDEYRNGSIGIGVKGEEYMRERFKRASLEVEAQKYEVGKGMEDGFELFTKVVTNGWIITDGLVKITQENGSIVCPFIQNRRGVVFIKEGDYIIYEDGGERHCCGEDKFHDRYYPI